jgi:hypothetical protein
MAEGILQTYSHGEEEKGRRGIGSGTAGHAGTEASALNTRHKKHTAIALFPPQPCPRLSAPRAPI